MLRQFQQSAEYWKGKCRSRADQVVSPRRKKARHTDLQRRTGPRTKTPNVLLTTSSSSEDSSEDDTVDPHAPQSTTVGSFDSYYTDGTRVHQAASHGDSDDDSEDDSTGDGAAEDQNDGSSEGTESE